MLLGLDRVGGRWGGAEVLDGVLARAEVDLLASTLEQEEVVEDVERLGRLCVIHASVMLVLGITQSTYRLMNRANDGEARPRQSSEQLDDPQRRLGVEPRRRFIAEEDRRTTDHLHRDGGALPLLRVETLGRGADNGVLNRGEVEQVQDDVDVGELCLARNTRILPEQRRELERLADRRAVICERGPNQSAFGHALEHETTRAHRAGQIVRRSLWCGRTLRRA